MNKRKTDTLKILIKSIYKIDSLTLSKITDINTRFHVQGRLLNRNQLSTINETLFGTKIKKEKPNVNILEITELISSGRMEQLNAIIKILISSSLPPKIWNVTATFLDDILMSVIMYTPAVMPTPVHKIRSVNEEVYWIHENEIIYIESRHNNVEYICSSNYTITSSNSLLNLENILSTDFIRIHRCYIANKTHVKCIRRCEVVMSNGDILPIPDRKYTKIKKLLTEE